MKEAGWSVVGGFCFGMALVLAIAFCRVALHLDLLR